MALILDTSVLYASRDRRDADHASCRRLLKESTEQLIIPAPVIVEVDYWTHQRLPGQARLNLIDDILAGEFSTAELTVSDYRRSRELRDRYWNVDVGFVDAAVLAVVERLNEHKLETLDHRHFRALRPRHVSALELLP